MTTTPSSDRARDPGGRGRDRILFVHVMKTGGTSLRRMLELSLGAQRVYPSTDDLAGLPGQRYLQSGPLLDRVGAIRDHRVLVGHVRASILDDLPPRYEGATMLRDPVARSLSMLDQWLTHVEPGRSRRELLEDVGFVDRFIRDYQTKVLATPSGEVQVPFRVTQEELAAARGRMESLAWVGLTEDFAGSVRRFDRAFGTHLAGTERVENASALPRDDVEGLRELIEPLVQHDLSLYEHARRLVA